MRPTDTRFYSGNLTGANAIVSRNVFLWPRVFEYFDNLFFGQLRGGTLFATIRRSVLNAVPLVIGCCVPSKIRQFIIERITVIVAAFLPNARKSMKCKKNDSSDAAKFVFIFFPQQNRRSPIFFVYGWLFYLPGFYRANSAKIRDFIKFHEISDAHPNFTSHNIIPVTVDMGIIA